MGSHRAETDPSTRAKREQRAYDEDRVWERSNTWHARFRHVFESPNTLRYEDLFRRLVATRSVERRVLEIGCGDGAMAEQIAGFGASYVLGIDISSESVATARPREVADRLEFRQGDVQQPLDPALTFDLIIGRSILHHIDYRPTLRLLYDRTLAPGGTMAFMEPLGSNPLVRIYHALGRAHTPDEASFERADLEWFRRTFRHIALYPINLLSFPLGVVSSRLLSNPDNVVLRFADRIDVWIAGHVRSAIPYYRHLLLVIDKPASEDGPADS